jgi:uncharacterized protein YbjT (DUF2867 family)
MRAGRTVLLIGATGLVGRHCLGLLLRDPGVSRVEVLTRRPLPDDLRHGGSAGPLRERVVDFDRLEEAPADAFAVDQVVCTLGTTIRKAGSRERFREVDRDLPIAVARRARNAGAYHFLLVSAIGADAGSRIFYNRVKGELEEAVRRFGFRSLTILRPSLLLGHRDEFRLGEEVARTATRAVRPLLPLRYRPVHAREVAGCLVRLAAEDAPGERVVESRDIHGKRRVSRFGRLRRSAV